MAHLRGEPGAVAWFRSRSGAGGRAPAAPQARPPGQRAHPARQPHQGSSGDPGHLQGREPQGPQHHHRTRPGRYQAHRRRPDRRVLPDLTSRPGRAVPRSPNVSRFIAVSHPRKPLISDLFPPSSRFTKTFLPHKGPLCGKRKPDWIQVYAACAAALKSGPILGSQRLDTQQTPYKPMGRHRAVRKRQAPITLPTRHRRT